MKKYMLLAAITMSLTSSANAADFTFSTDLRVGNSGQAVTELQSFLISNGYDIPLISVGNIPKGYFGLQTKAAVQRYQADQKLPTTGFVGPLTRGKLNSSGRANSLNVISPNGGEVWKVMSSQKIRWQTASTSERVDIFLYKNHSGCFNAINRPCLPVMDPEYKLASSIVNTGEFNWHVGTWMVPECVNCGAAAISAPLEGNNFFVKICNVTATPNVCDTSDAVFAISSTTSSNLPPVINGIDAPTTLSVGQTGTWTIRATDPEGGQLNYAVHWGGISYYCEMAPCPQLPIKADSFVQTATFTHSYESPWTQPYTVTFIVKDNAGNETRSSASVRVTGNSSTITVLSPNGGENWVSKSTQQIKWNYKNADTNSKVDLYLMGQMNCAGLCLDFKQAEFTLDKNISNSTIYNWIVGTDVVDNLIPTGNYLMKICVAGTTDCDKSDVGFVIVPQILY